MFISETLFAIVQMIGALIAGITALVACRQRKQPGSHPLFLLMLSVTLWAVSAGVKWLVAPEIKYQWAAMEMLGAGIASVLYLLFILEYVRQEKLFRRRTLLLLLVIPIGTTLIALVQHQTPHPNTFAPPDRFSWLPDLPHVFFIFLFYYYTLRLLGTGLLARSILSLSKMSRGQAWTLTAGAIAPWLGNITYAALAPSQQFSPASLELHALSYALSGLILGWGILRYRLLEIVPMAQDLVMENLRGLIITLDNNLQIIAINRPAQQILNLDIKSAFGMPVDAVLAGFPELVDYALRGGAPRQMHFPAPLDRYFEAEIIPITGQHKQTRGRLLVLHDITAQKQTEATLRTILETAPFPLSVTTLKDSRIVYANPVGIQFYELEPESYQGVKASRFYENVEQRKVILERLNAGLPVDNFELRMKTTSGKRLWVTVSMRKILYEGTESILTAQMDITQQKQVEEALRMERAQLQLIFDYAGLGIHILDKEGRYRFVNNRWAEMLGTEPTELIGQKDIMFLHPNDIPYNRQKLQELLAGEIGPYHLENRYRRLNGGLFWGEVNISPTFSSNGEIEAAIGFIIDVTKRKQAEIALKETERRFREILENVHLLAIMLDIEGNITFCNKYFQSSTGYTCNEIIGKNWLTTFVKTDEQVRQEFSRAMKRGVIASRHENYIPARNGEKLLISWSNIALKDENGQTIGMASIGEDITALRKAHQAEREQRLLAEALMDTSTTLVSSLDLNETMLKILKNVGNVVPHDAANVGLIRGQQAIFFRTHEHIDESHPANQPSSMQVAFKKVPLLLFMYKNQTPVVVPNVDEEPGWVVMPKTLQVKSYIGAPIIVKDKVVGFLGLNSERAGFFNQSHIERLMAFSTQAAIAIENARLFENSQHELEERRKAQRRLRRANKHLAAQLAEIEQLQAQLKEQAIRDPLTNLYNRRYLDETLQREIIRADRDDLPIAVLMLDIDHFKRINDTYGHESGDIVLKSLAGLLSKGSRRSDVTCRYGGEEFCIILPGTPMPIAQQRAEQWRQLFHDSRITVKNDTIAATISIGVAIYPEHGRSPADILAAADGALYTAKQNGRNCVIALPPQTTGRTKV